MASPSLLRAVSTAFGSPSTPTTSSPVSKMTPAADENTPPRGTPVFNLASSGKKKQHTTPLRVAKKHATHRMQIVIGEDDDGEDEVVILKNNNNNNNRRMPSRMMRLSLANAPTPTNVNNSKHKQDEEEVEKQQREQDGAMTPTPPSARRTVFLSEEREDEDGAVTPAKQTLTAAAAAEEEDEIVVLNIGRKLQHHHHHLPQSTAVTPVRGQAKSAVLELLPGMADDDDTASVVLSSSRMRQAQQSPSSAVTPVKKQAPATPFVVRLDKVACVQYGAGCVAVGLVVLREFAVKQRAQRLTSLLRVSSARRVQLWYKARKQAQKAHQQAVELEKRQMASALVIQTWWRTLACRYRYWRMRVSAVKMQRWWRNVMVRRQYLRLRKAVLRIQPVWRAVVVRRLEAKKRAAASAAAAAAAAAAERQRQIELESQQQQLQQDLLEQQQRQSSLVELKSPEKLATATAASLVTPTKSALSLSVTAASPRMLSSASLADLLSPAVGVREPKRIALAQVQPSLLSYTTKSPCGTPRSAALTNTAPLTASIASVVAPPTPTSSAVNSWSDLTKDTLPTTSPGGSASTKRTIKVTSSPAKPTMSPRKITALAALETENAEGLSTLELKKAQLAKVRAERALLQERRKKGLSALPQPTAVPARSPVAKVVGLPAAPAVTTTTAAAAAASSSQTSTSLATSSPARKSASSVMLAKSSMSCALSNTGRSASSTSKPSQIPKLGPSTAATLSPGPTIQQRRASPAPLQAQSAARTPTITSELGLSVVALNFDDAGCGAAADIAAQLPSCDEISGGAVESAAAIAAVAGGTTGDAPLTSDSANEFDDDEDESPTAEQERLRRQEVKTPIARRHNDTSTNDDDGDERQEEEEEQRPKNRLRWADNLCHYNDSPDAVLHRPTLPAKHNKKSILRVKTPLPGTVMMHSGLPRSALPGPSRAAARVGSATSSRTTSAASSSSTRIPSTRSLIRR